MGRANWGIALGWLTFLMTIPTVIGFMTGYHTLLWNAWIPVWLQASLLILVACLVIWKSSDGFEVASDYLGGRMNLEGGVKGATINAIGSSLPELFTTFFFLVVLQDTAGFAAGIGTTAGSAVFNAMIIPASVILAVYFTLNKRVKVNPRVILRDGLYLIFVEVVLIFCLESSLLRWQHGVLLMGLYLIYLATLKFVKVTDEEEEEEDDDWQPTEQAMLKAFFTLDLQHLLLKEKSLNGSRAARLLILSVIVMGVACHMLAEACTLLGKGLGMPPFIVAIIFASAATSVPDTVLSIKDARKGNYDDAVANALGSNIFDICFALGLPLAIYTLFNGPIDMAVSTEEGFISQFRILLLILTVIAFAIYLIGRYMGMLKAVLLLLLYVVFLIYTIDYTLSLGWMTWLEGLLAQASSFVAELNPLSWI
ncbi:hypothetical protein [Algivirga pacifica]|uniref:Sodium:calcium antiporter n=1 Tax=Algivirga pacifica TaxID=1162670 RepID=A0ABP9D8J4_9BACT